MTFYNPKSKPVRQALNHLKEDGILTPRKISEGEYSGGGTGMEEIPIPDKLADIFRSGSADWSKVK